MIDHWSTHKSSRQRNTVQYIVVHSTETPSGGTPEGTLAYLVRNDRGVSCHELVLPGPQVYRMAPDSWAAHHVGFATLPDGASGMLANRKTWGIEGYQVVGSVVAPEIHAVLVERVVAACKRFGLPSARVLGHREVDTQGKRDPRGIGMDEFRREVAIALGEVSAPRREVDEQLRALMLQWGEKLQTIRLNPNAALQKRILRDGLVPASPEFRLGVGGVIYAAQRAERVGDGLVRVYFTPEGAWDVEKILFVEEGPNETTTA